MNFDNEDAGFTEELFRKALWALNIQIFIEANNMKIRWVHLFDNNDVQNYKIMIG